MYRPVSLIHTGDGASGELVLCSLAIEAPLLLPPPRLGATADTAMHVVLDLRDSSVRLQSSGQGRRCETCLLPRLTFCV